MNEKENNKTALLKPRYAKWHDTKGGCVEDWMEIFADDIDFRSLAMGTGSGATFTTPCCSKDDLRSYFNGLLGGVEHGALHH